MANPPCEIEGCPNAAAFIGTFFNTGASITVCDDHFIEFAAGTLEAMTGIPVTLLITLPPDTFADPSAPPEGNVEAEPNVEEQPHEPDEVDGDVDDISRSSIADRLDAKHADITDAEFLTLADD